MSVMDLFRTVTPAPAPQGTTPPNPQSGNNGQPLPGTQATGQTAPNGTIPAGASAGNPGNPGDSNASPLAKFDDFWKNDPNSNNGTPPKLFNGLDPSKLLDAAKKVDFAKTISQEQLQAISAGGDGAMQAFAAALNSVAQDVYGQSAVATTKLVEQAVSTVRAEYDAKIPTMLRKVGANDQLAGINPAFASPALQPLTEALTTQFVRKNPNASQQEIQQQVVDYMSAVANVFGTPPKSNTPAATPGKGAEDWEKFFS